VTLSLLEGTDDPAAEHQDGIGRRRRCPRQGQGDSEWRPSRSNFQFGEHCGRPDRAPRAGGSRLARSAKAAPAVGRGVSETTISRKGSRRGRRRSSAPTRQRHTSPRREQEPYRSVEIEVSVDGPGDGRVKGKPEGEPSRELPQEFRVARPTTHLLFQTTFPNWFFFSPPPLELALSQEPLIVRRRAVWGLLHDPGHEPMLNA